MESLEIIFRIGGTTIPASFVKCVDDLVNSGKDKSSAYAICTAQYKKSHKGKNPQDAKASLEPTQEEIDAMASMYEEVTKARKKKKPMTVAEMRAYMKKNMQDKGMMN